MIKDLDKKYMDKLDTIAAAASSSEEYQKYLEEEEEEDYIAMRDIYEPQIAALYTEVANEEPLQILAFEQYLLDQKFEGMFLPRILGYSVLRGVRNEIYKYKRPQNHFRDILLAICNSFNFDFIKKRIGQTIQMGFAMSSDIWITNIINNIDNKRIRYFLQSQKLHKYRDPKERKIGLNRYQNQFKNENFFSTEFPTDKSSLKVLFPDVKEFIIQRIKLNINNDSFKSEVRTLLENESFKGSQEHLEILSLFIHFFDLEGSEYESVKNIFNEARKEPGFKDRWLSFVLELHNSDLVLDGKADNRVFDIIDDKLKDDLSDYYNLMYTIHGKGYIDPEVAESVRKFYARFEGMSDINKSVRKVIFNYFARVLKNLDVTNYTELFELSKSFPIYIDIFSNQQFNQNIKDLCMIYVKSLLRKYVDKRGKDYQDIKKFVSTSFLDFGFLTKKQIVELFKTRRKKKPMPTK